MRWGVDVREAGSEDDKMFGKIVDSGVKGICISSGSGNGSSGFIGGDNDSFLPNGTGGALVVGCVGWGEKVGGGSWHAVGFWIDEVVDCLGEK